MKKKGTFLEKKEMFFDIDISTHSYLYFISERCIIEFIGSLNKYSLFFQVIMRFSIDWEGRPSQHAEFMRYWNKILLYLPLKQFLYQKGGFNNR